MKRLKMGKGDVLTSFRLSKKLFQFLKKDAKRQETSVNYLIVKQLEKYESEVIEQKLKYNQ